MGRVFWRKTTEGKGNSMGVHFAHLKPQTGFPTVRGRITAVWPVCGSGGLTSNQTRHSRILPNRVASCVDDKALANRIVLSGRR